MPITVSKKITGDKGELEVVDLVACPNCKRKLMLLPKSYPLYDVQCVGCSFRAQIKTSNHKPRGRVFGAGWNIIDKVLKSGYMVPPLMVNFKWKEKGRKKQEIYFYPFVPKQNLRKYLADIKSRNRKHWMFVYQDLDQLPSITVYKR